jgi:hypothetical protein
MPAPFGSVLRIARSRLSVSRNAGSSQVLGHVGRVEGPAAGSLGRGRLGAIVGVAPRAPVDAGTRSQRALGKHQPRVPTIPCGPGPDPCGAASCRRGYGRGDWSRTRSQRARRREPCRPFRTGPPREGGIRGSCYDVSSFGRCSLGSTNQATRCLSLERVDCPWWTTTTSRTPHAALDAKPLQDRGLNLGTKAPFAG